MSKNKQISKSQERKNKLMQIIAIIVIISFIGLLVFSKFFISNVEVDSQLEKAVSNKTVYSFTKEGELSFNDAKGNLITSIDVEIADTDEQRQLGLMYRDKMDKNQGMLFIFDKEAPQAFWMHNTILPLDIIYVNSKSEIVHIVKNAKPFDDTSLPSVKPAQFVVEVNAGYCDKFGIKVGDKIVWRRI